MNLPNRLTLFRIVLIPLLVLIYLFPYAQFNIELQSYVIGSVTLPAVNLICLGIYAVSAFRLPSESLPIRSPTGCWRRRCLSSLPPGASSLRCR